MKQYDAINNIQGARARLAWALPCGLAGLMLALPVWGQQFPNLPITSEQTATAQKVAQAGVPLSELAPDAPDSYVVKRGDTLWAISTMFLRSPWRWPELWGMNLQEIANPHLIFPGQTLYLEKRDGVARLRQGTPPAATGPTDAGTPAAGDRGSEAATAAPASSGEPRVVKLSPRIREESLRSPLSTLDTRFIEPFLAEPLIVEEGELAVAPRIVSSADNRVVIGRGDRVYARGPANAPLMDDQQKVKLYRLFRNPTALKDPDTGEVLGYEAEFLGKATLARGEAVQDITLANGNVGTVPVPATIDILSAKSEMLVGDRMVPDIENELLTFTPRAPSSDIKGRIVSIYGSAVANASQNQVVVINRGKRDGLVSGHVLAILKDGARKVDTTDPARPLIKLPNERNGLMMVFRTFEKLSYGLVLDITDGVQVGDRFVTPQ